MPGTQSSLLQWHLVNKTCYSPSFCSYKVSRDAVAIVSMWLEMEHRTNATGLCSTLWMVHTGIAVPMVQSSFFATAISTFSLSVSGDSLNLHHLGLDKSIDYLSNWYTWSPPFVQFSFFVIWIREGSWPTNQIELQPMTLVKHPSLPFCIYLTYCINHPLKGPEQSFWFPCKITFWVTKISHILFWGDRNAPNLRNMYFSLMANDQEVWKDSLSGWSAYIHAFSLTDSSLKCLFLETWM